MSRVVDASVAVKWFVEEIGTPQARAVLERDDPLIAPELLVAEVCNVTWKKQLRGEVSAEQAGLLVRTVPTMFDRLHACSPLADRALQIAVALEHPAYDGFYLALAEVEDATLITDDARLLERVRGTEWERLVEALR